MSRGRPGLDRSYKKPALRREIAALRDIALQTKGWETCPILPQFDAEEWQKHDPSESWLIWRGSRVANRLRKMPIEILPGERLVGRPLIRQATAAEREANERAWEVLKTMPPYPGGDAGHFHPDYEKLFRVGLGGILDEIRTRLGSATTDEQRSFYRACEIAMQGFSDYILRVAEECDRNPEHAELARICRRIATQPPETFHEAIELMFLTLSALWVGEDHWLTTPARMDQTLRPFYEADISAGRITREEALELICCLYIQMNMIIGPGSAISVTVGGRDRNGQDVTNELTYLCLDARAATRLVYPTLGLAWHEGTPSELTAFACRMLATGVGDPAFFNDQLIVEGLRSHGVSVEDSYNYMNSTCVEIKVVGASNIWVTTPYFNCPQAMLDAMDTAVDGSAPEPASFDEFSELVRARIADDVRQAAERFDRVWTQRGKIGCFPLASCLTNDCLEKGLDIDQGGARYNWVENSFVGLANLVDGMMAVKMLVYDSGELSISEFREILKADYAGHEDLRLRIINSIPSYGTDADDVDALATEWAEFLQSTSESNTVGGHCYVPGFFCWVMHGELGSRTGATPDGRKSGTAFADGAGAAQGREVAGPTASILSTTKWDHQRVLGGLVHNLRLSGQMLKDRKGLDAMSGLIETYMRRGGFEIQVNVVGGDILRAAQAHPEDYPDLLVRVAGYSDYFTNLSPVMQAEVIERTEHSIC